jgi:hypothetical protein
MWKMQDAQIFMDFFLGENIFSVCNSLQQEMHRLN